MVDREIEYFSGGSVEAIALGSELPWWGFWLDLTTGNRSWNS